MYRAAILLIYFQDSTRLYNSYFVLFSSGFKTVDEYYRAAGSHQRVGGIKIPLLVVQAEDDPIAPIQGTPMQALYDNPNCILAGAAIAPAPSRT
jgi:predicted alpha/beta-fold hydrolase